jgi:two-component system sensor histidine kinase DesK
MSSYSAEPRYGWVLFNLVYLAFFFVGWLWDPPALADIIAALVAIALFLPLYFHAFERSEPRFIANATVMELIAWGLSPFAGIHGVFHVYACVQCAFQRPRRRAIWLIALFTLAYLVFALFFVRPGFVILINLFFGAVIGYACTAAADGIEREQRLKRSRVLERQRATLAERERIAQDLHDLLGQTLTTVALKAELAGKLVDRDPQRAKREFDEVATAARHALDEIRAAVYDMTTTSVENEIALARQALDAAGVSLEVASDLPPLTPQLGKVLGLTIREATTNIVRHSGADSARIDIGRDGAQLALTIADNGHGSEQPLDEGAGLAGLRRRISALGGETAIEHDQGMRIRVSLPLDAGRGKAPERRIA